MATGGYAMDGFSTSLGSRYSRSVIWYPELGIDCKPGPAPKVLMPGNQEDG